MDSDSRMSGDVCAASDSTAGARRERERRRRITPEAGRALEILGHAIDYLTDEYIHAGGPLSGRDAHVESVQLLMRINRQVYFACPEAPTLRERIGLPLRLGTTRKKAAPSP
jgi:hypothetical protein